MLTSSDSQETLERLSVLCKSQDGFEIAQRDLEMRGPGEFLGTRQSGLGDSKITRLIRDMDMLKEAQEMAHRVLNDPIFEKDRQPLLDEVNAVYEKKLQSIAMN
jgi:ATP-dependent DNA helicase RecG